MTTSYQRQWLIIDSSGLTETSAGNPGKTRSTGGESGEKSHQKVGEMKTVPSNNTPPFPEEARFEMIAGSICIVQQESCGEPWSLKVTKPFRNRPAMVPSKQSMGSRQPSSPAPSDMRSRETCCAKQRPRLPQWTSFDALRHRCAPEGGVLSEEVGPKKGFANKKPVWHVVSDGGNHRKFRHT